MQIRCPIPVLNRTISRSGNVLVHGLDARFAAGAIYLLALCFTCSAADDLRVDMKLQPEALNVGETATMTFTIRGVGNPPIPQLPKIEGLQIAGPSVANKQIIINANIDTFVELRYQVMPMRPGKFKLGPFMYSAGGKMIQIPAVELEAVAPGGAGTAQQPALKDLLFAKIGASRTTVFNQEMFDITISLYSSGVNLAGEISIYNMPKTGMSLQPWRELQSGREVIDGRVYQVRRWAAKLQALSAGTYTVKPNVRVQVHTEKPRPQKRRSIWDDPFADFFFNRRQVQPVDLEVNALEIRVQPLPTQGQQKSFVGGVGQFQFKVAVSPTDLNVGDPITIQFEIVGTGNVDAVTAPDISFGSGFKTYEAKLTRKDLAQNRAYGIKTFEQVLIPRNDEITEVPSIDFSYFDPETGQYRTVTKGPFPLTVHAATGAITRVVQAQGSQILPEEQVLGMDIVYLKGPPAKWVPVREKKRRSATLGLGIQVAPALAVLAVFITARRREDLARDVAKARRHKAPKSARAAIKKAQEAARRENQAAFYEALWEALSSYFGNRLNLSPGEVTKETTVDALKRGGVKEEHMHRIERLYEVCEQARFGLGSDEHQGADQMRAQITELSDALRICERVRL